MFDDEIFENWTPMRRNSRNTRGNFFAFINSFTVSIFFGRVNVTGYIELRQLRAGHV